MTPAPPLYAIAVVHESGRPIGYVPHPGADVLAPDAAGARKFAGPGDAAAYIAGEGRELAYWCPHDLQIVGLLDRGDGVPPPRIVGVVAGD